MSGPGVSVASLFRLDGRTALVTGGARHLGLDMAEALAECGCDIVLTSRGVEAAKKAAAAIAERHGHKTLGLELDVRDDAADRDAVEHALALTGRIDILINNAGGGSGAGAATLTERPASAVREMIETNLVGTILMCAAVAPHMIARGRGKIINIASIAGIVGRDRRIYAPHGMAGQPVDYAAAKGGIIAVTRDLAGALSPEGINVNCISPGGFGPRSLPDGFVRDYADRTPLGAMGRDGIDLKGAAVFLAAPASDYVTGHNLVVDGGFSIWK